jgi:hypothetical protein
MPAPTINREEPRLASHVSGGFTLQADRRRRETDGPNPPRRVSDSELLVAIGRDLAAVYAEILHQPLPERLANLLQQIEANNLRHCG